MKRILYVGGFELPDRNPAAHRVLSIAKALREDDIEVILLGVSNITKKCSVLDSKKKIDGFDAFSRNYPAGISKWMRYLTSISDVLKVVESYGNIDGIICYNYQAVALERLRKYCNQHNIKIYSDCTEWYSTDGQNVLFKIIKGFDIWYRMHIVHKRLDGIIAISRYLERYYSVCRDTLRIPPLVDVQEKKWKIQPKCLGNNINFVYSGSPGVKDKIAVIVTAFLKLPSKYKYDLWIIGISKGEFIDRYMPDNNNVTISDNIHFLGRIPHNENIAYLKGADCSLIIRESNRTNNAGFPTKFVEAVTADMDIIATDVSDLSEYSDRTHLFIVRDDLQKSLVRYFDSYKKRDKKLSSVFDYRQWKDNIVNFITKNEAVKQ